MKAWPIVAALLAATTAFADRPRTDEPEFPSGDDTYPTVPQLMRPGLGAFPVKGEEPRVDTRPRFAEAPHISPPPRVAPDVRSPPPPTAAEAASPDLQRLATRVLLVQWKAEQVRSWFSDGKNLQSQHDLLLEHLARMADLVEGGGETRPVDPVLLRSVEVGAELAELTLEVMALDYFARRERIRIQAAANLVLRDFLWEGIRELESDYRWPVVEKEQAARVLTHARGHRKAIKFTFDSAAAGMAGVTAASFVSGGYSMAQFVGALPEMLVAGRGLGQVALARVVAWLEKAGGGGGGGFGIAIGPNGASVALYVTAGARGAQLVLTEAEIAALVGAGQLTATTGQLVLASMAATRAATPAQIARAGGLSGTNSVGGVTPPGFTSTQQWDTAANSDRLRRAMQKKKITFATGEDAHHVVPSTHRRGEEARRILDEFGIDINAAENGVKLPQGSHHGKGLHSFDTIDAVTARLRRARLTGREGVLEALDEIGEVMAKGNGYTGKE